MRFRFGGLLLAALSFVPMAAQAAPPVKRHVIYYLTCDRSPWEAYMNGDVFTHRPRSGSPSHRDTVIHYLTWDGTCWSASWNIQRRQFEHTPLTRPGPMHRDEILNFLDWRNDRLTIRKTFDDYFMVSSPN